MHVLSRCRHSDEGINFVWIYGKHIGYYWESENNSDYDPYSDPDHYHSNDNETIVGVNKEHSCEDEVYDQEEYLEHINE